MLESFTADSIFARWKTVNGVFPEININLFATPKTTHSRQIKEATKILCLKNSATDIVKRIIAVLKIKVKGVCVI